MSAAMRIQNGRGWVRPDGQPVAESVAQLSLEDLYYPPTLTEKNQVVPSDFTVLTGTTFDGQTFNGKTCTDWTMASGEAAGGFLFAGTFEWQNVFTLNCAPISGVANRIYC